MRLESDAVYRLVDRHQPGWYRIRLSVRVVERQFWLREDPVAQGIVLWTFNPVPAGFFVCCAKEVPGELTSASVPWCCLWFLQTNEQNSHMRLFALA